MRTLRTMILAGFVAVMAASCAKNSDIDDLQKQINTLKSGQIASIENQITSINTSIKDLQKIDATLEGYIDDLKSRASALEDTTGIHSAQIAVINKAVENLKAKDTELDEKISDLQKYVNEQLTGTKDWAGGTFATLEKFDSLSLIVSDLSVRIQGVADDLTQAKLDIKADYTAAISTAVGNLEVSMKDWVNEKFADYWTIAQSRSQLDALEKKLTDADTEMQKQITDQKEALAKAKEEITDAYTKAIGTAINTLEGNLNTKIANDIAAAKNALQSQIDAVNATILDISGRLARIETDVKGLIDRIQSIVVIPTYSDGSVKVTDSEDDVITFLVLPKSVIDSIVTKGGDLTDFSFDVAETLTKGDAPSITVRNASINENGQLEITAGTKGIGDFFTGTQSLSASLIIETKDGYASKSSEYFPLCMGQTQILSFPKSEYTSYIEGTFSSPAVSGAVTTPVYSSDDRNVAEVDSGTGAVTIKGNGTCTITAVAPSDDTYAKGSASYKLTVKSCFIQGKFSVADSKKVKFAAGNLQYLGLGTNQDRTPKWRFADNQYDVMGAGPSADRNRGNVDLSPLGYSTYNTGSGCAGGSETEGDRQAARDLFGWGCTGSQDMRAHTYQTNCQPYSTSKTLISTIPAYSINSYGYGPDYDATSRYNLSVTDQSDWGCISTLYGNTYSTRIWRTLTKEEWEYLLNTDNAVSGARQGNRFAKARVNGVNGLVIFPDGYTGTTACTGMAAVNISKNPGAVFPAESIPAAVWSGMEAAGAVFLPASGYREGSNTYQTSGAAEQFVDACVYWTSTSYYNVAVPEYNPMRAYEFYCYDGDVLCKDGLRYYGCAVRLVSDITE